MNPLGRERLPVGYTRLAYLESIGTTRNEISYIKLDLSFNYKDRVVFETLHKIAQNQKTNNAELRNSNNYFFWGVKSDGYEYFGFPDMTVLNTDIVAATDYAKYRLEINNLDFRFYVNENLHAEKQVKTGHEQRIGVFCALSDFGNSYPFHGKKKYFKVWIRDRIVYHLVPCLDTGGVPCMFDLTSRKPFYNEGTGEFVAGVENQVQLNNLLSKLPDRTGQDVGTLTVRLADELQTPENEAKLDALRAKNWEITQAV